MRFITLTAIFFASTLATEVKRYDNWQMWKLGRAITTLDATQQQAYSYIVGNSSGRVINFFNHLLVAPEFVPQIVQLRSRYQVPMDIAWFNFQEILDATEAVPSRTPHTWNRYQTLEEVYAFMAKQAQKHWKVVTPLLAGYSHEGRPIRGVKISFGLNKLPRSVFIESGIHAAEWITYESATYLMDRILNDKSEGADLLRQYDWYIFPVVNPDGLFYTQNYNRVWRANRKPVENSTCVGADLNRNFGFRWGNVGSSSDPCSINYAGPYPFSEPETQAIRDFVMPRREQFDLYLCLHNYGQLLLWSYGNGPIEPLPNQEDIEAIAGAVAEAYRKRGATYIAGNAQQILYSSSGTARDWATGEAQIPLVYTYEFSPYHGSTESNYMFFLPTTRIRQNVEEFYDSIIALVTKGKERGYFQYQELTWLDYFCKWVHFIC